MVIYDTCAQITVLGRRREDQASVDIGTILCSPDLGQRLEIEAVQNAYNRKAGEHTNRTPSNGKPIANKKPNIRNCSSDVMVTTLPEFSSLPSHQAQYSRTGPVWMCLYLD